MTQRRLAFLNVETTGLSPLEHEMVEFAVVFEDDTSVTFKIKPKHIETATPIALKVNGYNEADWADALEPEEAAKRIAAAINECLIVGQNVKFDIGFVDALARLTGVEIKTRYGLDLVTLSFEHLMPIGLDSLSMKNVCKFLKIEPEPEIHRAVNGAAMCKKVWNMLLHDPMIHTPKANQPKMMKTGPAISDPVVVAL